jgi:hypothetical protein
VRALQRVHRVQQRVRWGCQVPCVQRERQHSGCRRDGRRRRRWVRSGRVAAGGQKPRDGLSLSSRRRMLRMTGGGLSTATTTRGLLLRMHAAACVGGWCGAVPGWEKGAELPAAMATCTPQQCPAAAVCVWPRAWRVRRLLRALRLR